MPKHIPIEPGTRFGALTVNAKSTSVNGHVHYLVDCQCGQSKSIRAAYLRSGEVKSCGCDTLTCIDSQSKSIQTVQELSLTGIDSQLKSMLADFKVALTLVDSQLKAMREQQAEILQLLNHLSLPQVTQGDVSTGLTAVDPVEVTEPAAVTDTLDWTDAVTSNILPAWEQTFPEPSKPPKEPQLKNYSLQKTPAQSRAQLGARISRDWRNYEGNLSWEEWHPQRMRELEIELGLT